MGSANPNTWILSVIQSGVLKHFFVRRWAIAFISEFGILHVLVRIEGLLGQYHPRQASGWEASRRSGIAGVVHTSNSYSPTLMLANRPEVGP